MPKKIEVTPLFWRAASDMMYAANVCIVSTNRNAQLIKLISELDLELKSISKELNSSEDDNKGNEGESTS